MECYARKVCRRNSTSQESIGVHWVYSNAVNWKLWMEVYSFEKEEEWQSGVDLELLTGTWQDDMTPQRVTRATCSRMSNSIGW